MMERKIFVLDTNVLIHSPQALFSFEENRIVIPIVVIEEIDQFKKGVDEKSRNARQIGRYLDALRERGSLQEGVITEHGGIVQISVNNEVTDTASQLMYMDKVDNMIIGTALYFRDKYPDSIVTLVSKDANVRIKADCVGVRAENYESDNVRYDEYYTGWSEDELSPEQYETLMTDRFLPNTGDMYFPNEFIRFSLKEGKDKILTSRYSKSRNVFSLLEHYQGQEIYNITSRNHEQDMAMDLLLDDQIKLVTLSGKAGTGKTLLAIAAGLHKVITEDRYKRLVISRPISPLGKDLGYLPGSKTEKFNPWMQPIYDNMDILLPGADKTDSGDKGRKKTTIFDLMDYGYLELEPLTYIRGRSLPKQFIIIDEAKNLTPHEMKTIITRAGKDTKIVLTGDPYQIDTPYLDSVSNGLSVAVERLKHEEMVGHITLDIGERSPLADLAAKYF